MRKESHVAAALKYIEENLPVGEDGLYGLVNNAGVSHYDCSVVVDLSDVAIVVTSVVVVVVVVLVREVTVVVSNGGVVACGSVGDFSPWSTLLG